jgi:adenosylcobinamide kinase/adenosylcobinamide-phosphate guanylyltransferase
VLYLATAEAGDEEMAARIAAHRAERPAHWQALEAPRHIGQALVAHLSRLAGDAPDVIVLDCLTLLASNLIAPMPEPITAQAAEAALNAELEALLSAYASSQAEWMVISNEVGLGLVPPYPLGRVYRDALGKANQRLAAVADEVLLMVAGLPLRLKG